MAFNIRTFNIETFDDLLQISNPSGALINNHLFTYIQQVKMISSVFNINFDLTATIVYYLRNTIYSKELITELINGLYVAEAKSIEYTDFIDQLNILYEQKRNNYIFDIDRIIKTNNYTTYDSPMADIELQILLTFYQSILVNKQLTKLDLEERNNIVPNHFTDKMFELAYEADDMFSVEYKYNQFVELYEIYKKDLTNATMSKM